MRALQLLALCTLAALCLAAPQRSKLQLVTESGSQPFVEEVVVESVLNVRAPTTSRQARTNLQQGTSVSLTKTNLQQGTSVSLTKTN